MKTKLKILIFIILAINLVLPVSVLRAETVEPNTRQTVIPSPNNRFGIHLNEPESDIEHAKLLVNSNGDWGWVVMVIRSNDRDKEKWQRIFNKLREDHLIPVVRIAGKPNAAGYWERPTNEDAKTWADFLDSLIWPIKTRFVTLYNEPNHSGEWGGEVDPVDYANRFVEQAKLLKEKSNDFFILNGAIDAAPPDEMPKFASFEYFVSQAVAGNSEFLQYIDGWASHSYPNPDFAAPVTNTGKASVKSYVYEKTLVESLGKKIDYVFVTETGWKHSEGVNVDGNRISAEEVAGRYKTAYQTVWTEDYLVMVAPFIIDYPDKPFDNFSFLNPKVLGERTEKYLPNFEIIRNLPKNVGKAFQETKAKFENIGLKNFYRKGSNFEASVTFKNIGQSLWGDNVEVTPRITGTENITDLRVEKITNSELINVNENETWKISGNLAEKGVITLGFTPIDQNQNSLSKPVNMPIYVSDGWEYVYLSARDILSGIL